MLSKEIVITDSHHHLWTPDTHSWVKDVKDSGHPAGPFKSIQNYLLPEFLADIEPFNITKSVHLQCFMDGDPINETKSLQTIADSNPKGFPHGIVSHCDLTSPDVSQVLINHMKYPNFRGTRQLLNFHPDKKIFCEAKHDNYLTDVTWQQGYSLLAEHKLTFDMHILPRQYLQAYDVIKANPTINVVINHCGVMYERDEATMKLWRDGLAMLASLPNCFMKLSGLAMVHINPDDLVPIKSIVQELIGLFGTDRCMYGSNFPVDKVNATYQQLIKAMEFSIADYTLEEKKNIFANNANTFYRL
ncbi:hypothetical protein LOD99_14657 [Oopsacas minuta]|uniref:Amidohydrolase-related domain-containing protein n=1 Tax=Oopsacas minuta TaxID=111878 RepID=A0AAV7KD59_9METZ|nr:hypothetical protein LOD99_14657 [Oopsacas minuta]